jgi:GDP-L-fucose synthase
MDSDSGFWKDRKVLVTGAAGFLGSHVVRMLKERGCGELLTPGREEVDLTQPSRVRGLLQHDRPDLIIHLAAEVGGIGANLNSPGRFFYSNLVMGLHLIEEARLAGVGKFVQLGTICAYPKHTPVPFREEDLWNGYPEETNAPYGIAKKALLVQLQAYRAQYGFAGIYLLPVNLYGPGDNFDLETSHVIPALIRKMVEAREAGSDRVVLWGTGSASREFLFVEDCARAVLLAAEKYSDSEPVNIGTGSEISVRNLANEIAHAVGYEGKIDWDTSRPDGQPRRCLDTSRAAEAFGFEAAVPFDVGLERTVRWYLESRSDP